MGRTLARAQAALAWSDSTSQTPTSPPSTPPPPCAPLSDADLRSYLGPGGRLLRPHDLRLHVYHGGVEPGLRKVSSQPFPPPLFIPKFVSFCPHLLSFPPQKVAWAQSCLNSSLLSPYLCVLSPRCFVVLPKMVVWAQSLRTHFFLLPNLLSLPWFFVVSSSKGSVGSELFLLSFVGSGCGLFRPDFLFFPPQKSGVGSEPSHPPFSIAKPAFFCPDFFSFPPPKVVWRYLLNVFPAGLSGQERLAHLRRKADEYAALKSLLASRAAPAELALVAAAVRKDVVRTDRGHPYFGGPEEGHPHLAALQALLTTFALGHPRLSYCQGMSDVAAPLLAVLDDEAQAFLCFCSLMRRLGPRFRPGGRGLARAFSHLRRLLRRADPPFWAFLAARGAHDLLFCYRWLLLELKREFAFEDALRVLEITWSSLPPAPPPPPEGIPLLGAPLGARRARRGLRERRGMRPRPPRRRREKRGGGVAGSSEDKLKAEGSEPIACCPETCSNDGPKDPKTSRGSCAVPKDVSAPEVCGQADVYRKAGENSEGVSADLSCRGVVGGPESLEDIGTKSACEGRAVQSPKEVGEKPNQVSGDCRETSGELRGTSRSSSIQKEVCAEPGEAGGGLSDTQKAGEGATKVIKGDQTPQEVSGDPKGSGEVAQGVGRDPGAAKEFGEDPKEVGDDHREVGEDPKEVGEGAAVAGEPGDDPTEPHGDPTAADALQDPWAGGWAWEDSWSFSSSSSSSSSSEEEDLGVEDDGAPLPPPAELGQGNPFLLFVCLAMLLEQREAVMARAGDYNEVAMHFDRLVRRHQLPRVLRRAKGLFARYLEGWGGAAPGSPTRG